MLACCAARCAHLGPVRVNKDAKICKIGFFMQGIDKVDLRGNERHTINVWTRFWGKFSIFGQFYLKGAFC